MARTTYSEQIKRRAAQLRKEGQSISEITTALKISSESIVYRWLEKAGLHTAKTRAGAAPVKAKVKATPATPATPTPKAVRAITAAPSPAAALLAARAHAGTNGHAPAPAPAADHGDVAALRHEVRALRLERDALRRLLDAHGITD